MQIIITGRGTSRTRVLNVARWHVVAMLLALLALPLALLLALPALPLPLSPLQQTDADALPAERVLRENLDAMATRLGEMQAKLIKLEAVGERVSNLAGVKPDERREIVKPVAGAASGARGGPFVPAAKVLTQQQLLDAFGELDERFDQHLDLFTLIESRLFEDKMATLAVPNTRPLDGPVGSGFGMRSDPFTGRAALHTGLDFPADSGTPILAAAGGVVLSAGLHAAYGQELQIDHGNGLVTRYAHCSKVLVKAGDLVRRGQPVALVGSTGRSTGPHLHFEVLVDGAPQNPAKFLAGGTKVAGSRR
jgi:murein DD-endopeptidase MepM/ murein hydrolase activator NlpD